MVRVFDGLPFDDAAADGNDSRTEESVIVWVIGTATWTFDVREAVLGEQQQSMVHHREREPETMNGQMVGMRLTTMKKGRRVD